MSKLFVSLPLMVGTLVLVAAPVWAQDAGKAGSNAPVAGKATAAKATPAKATPERKKYEFTAAKAATPAAATLAPTEGTVQPAAAKDKSSCHSRGSDA